MVNIPAQTVMQEQAPEEERGRIFSFQSMLFNAGSLPVLLFAGVIGDTLGVETVLYLLAAAILVFSWWAARSSHRYENGIEGERCLLALLSFRNVS